MPLDFDSHTGETLKIALRESGFARLDAGETFKLLGHGAAASWIPFARSWENLGSDLFMEDGGRYRRRRYAAFRLFEGRAERKPHQPHFQSRDHNPLNGDVQRWFEPVDEEVAGSCVIRAVFDLCGPLFAMVSPGQADRPWHIEFHQFRIETSPQHLGRPTPEGLHRDGVDWVFVMLIRRENISQGVTQIGSLDGKEWRRFMLADPGDAVLLDDHRIMHGVTEVHAIDVTRPAFRDVLVVTFIAEN